jgi:hypothetical protein
MGAYLPREQAIHPDLGNQLSILRGSDQPRFDLRRPIGRRTDLPRSTSPNRPDGTSFDHDSGRGSCKAAGQRVASRRGRYAPETHPGRSAPPHAQYPLRRGASHGPIRRPAGGNPAAGSGPWRPGAHTRPALTRVRGHGELDQVQGVLSAVLRDQERFHGSSHPRTLATRYDHALVMRLTRGAQAAAALLAALEEDCRQALGSSHPLTQTIAAARR